MDQARAGPGSPRTHGWAVRPPGRAGAFTTLRCRSSSRRARRVAWSSVPTCDDTETPPGLCTHPPAQGSNRSSHTHTPVDRNHPRGKWEKGRSDVVQGVQGLRHRSLHVHGVTSPCPSPSRRQSPSYQESEGARCQRRLSQPTFYCPLPLRSLAAGVIVPALTY